MPTHYTPGQVLAAGESFELPPVTVGLFRGDLDDMAARLYAWQFEYMWDFTYEDWFPRMPEGVEGWYGDHNLQQQFAGRLGHADPDAVDAAQALGMGLIHNDAGWAADPNIWALNWEGPDFSESLRYMAKTDMKWLLWLPGDPSMRALDSKIGAYGNLMYRIDAVLWSSGDFVRPLLRDKLIPFLRRHPRSTHQGWHGFNWQRLTSHGQQDNDFTDFDLNVCAASFLSIPDKWYDGVFPNRDHSTRGRWLAQMPVAGGVEADVQVITTLYRYLIDMGLVGRWAFVAHPGVVGESPEYCLQRVSFDGERSVIVPRYQAKGPVTIMPRRLNPASEYLVEWFSGKPPARRMGADLMANGIAIDGGAPFEFVFLNLPGRPGGGHDRTAPQPPGRVLVRCETNVGHTGMMVYWSPGSDDNWVSVYEVRRRDTALGRVATGLAFFDRTPGWDAGGEYFVRTVDGDGNASAWTKASLIAGEPPVYAALGGHYAESGRNGWSAQISGEGRDAEPMTWRPRGEPGDPNLSPNGRGS